MKHEASRKYAVKWILYPLFFSAKDNYKAYTVNACTVKAQLPQPRIRTSDVITAGIFFFFQNNIL